MFLVMPFPPRDDYVHGVCPNGHNGHQRKRSCAKDRQIAGCAVANRQEPFVRRERQLLGRYAYMNGAQDNSVIDVIGSHEPV